jgi:DNA/RNA endonuclease YhcR with UshA esterase domain
MKLAYVSLTVCLLFGVPTLSARAQESPEIYLSEINWAGSERSTSDEWLELYNGDDETVDLSGWILTGTATGGAAIEIEAGISLESEGVLLISNFSIEDDRTTLTVEPNLVTPSLSLSNSSQHIMLAMPDGVVVDEVGDESEPLFGSRDPIASMERDLTSLEWFTAMTSVNLADDQLGTPGAIVIAEVEEVHEVEEVSEALDEIEIVEDLEKVLEPEVVEELEVPEEEIEIIEDEIDEDDDLPEPVIKEVEEEDKIVTPVPVEVPIPLPQPEPVYYLGQILINEVVSNPDSGDEWVELLNPGVDDIDLTSWYFEDASGRSILIDEVVIEAGEYVVIDISSGYLNNGGDDLSLFAPSTERVDYISYGGDEVSAPGKGESLILFEDLWEITDILTPSKDNIQIIRHLEQDGVGSNGSLEIFEATNDPEDCIHDHEPLEVQSSSNEDSKVHKIISIAKEVEVEKSPETPSTVPTMSKASSASDQTTIDGVLTALPGTFGDQIAFIDGISLYFYYADWPFLQLGDELRIKGTLSESRGEQRLKIAQADDIEIISSGALAAQNVTASRLSSISAGTLVRVSGAMAEQNDDEIILEDETGSLTIVAHKKTGISWHAYTGGDLEVIGVLRVFGGEARVYPRNPGDIRVLQREGADVAVTGGPALISSSAASGPLLGIGIIATALALILAAYLRTRKKKFTLPIPKLQS